MNDLSKRLTSGLPQSWQHELKRLKCRREIQHRTFRSYEPAFLILDSLISAGDWVIDIGANGGHYTNRFCDLVGPQGRVIAVEPVAKTFAMRYCSSTPMSRYSMLLPPIIPASRECRFRVSRQG